MTKAGTLSDSFTYDVPAGMRLHIGGSVRAEGWTVLDALPGEHVDIVGDCRDLSMFGDGSCALIYASHVLEHLGYDQELPAVLREFHRLLAPNGLLLTSVPDMDVLCRLFIDPELGVQDKFLIMRMMFGGRKSPYDVHFSGLNEQFLAEFLLMAGFTELLRLDRFGLFADTSDMMFAGHRISLNLIARKPSA